MQPRLPASAAQQQPVFWAWKRRPWQQPRLYRKSGTSRPTSLWSGPGRPACPRPLQRLKRALPVIILEQGKEIGGCGVIAGGILNIGGGTRVQKLNKIEDSPDRLFQQLSSYKSSSNKRNDPALLRVYCDYNPGTVDWLEARGVRFMDSITRAGAGGAMHQQAYHHIWWDKEGPGAAFLKTPEGYANGAGLIKPLEALCPQEGHPDSHRAQDDEDHSQGRGIRPGAGRGSAGRQKEDLFPCRKGRHPGHGRLEGQQVPAPAL